LRMAAWATSLKFSTATRPSGLAAVSRRRGAWQKYCGRWWRMFTDCGRCYSRRFQLRRPERPPPCGLRYRDRPVCGPGPIHKRRMYVTSGRSVSPEDSQARARASMQAGQGAPAPSSDCRDLLRRKIVVQLCLQLAGRDMGIDQTAIAL
jgi:hypothetical protein